MLVRKLLLSLAITGVAIVFHPNIALAICLNGAGGAGGATRSNGSNGCDNIQGGGGGGGGGGSAAGGRGGSGAGGGALFKGNVSISGTVNALGGGSSATNGGTVKVFFTGTEPSRSGITSGRTLFAASCVPGTAADDSSIGTLTWATPANGKVADNAYASAAGAVSNALSHYLVLTACSFTVPASGSIMGVKAEFLRFGDNGLGSSNIVDNAVRLVKGGTIQTTDRSSVTSWQNGSSRWDTYGGNTDMWGTTLTVAEANASNLGVAISASVPWNGLSVDTAYIDATEITVYYNTIPAAPTLIYPINNSSGNSASPTFQLRSSDAESDYLKYKIEVCANSGCSSVIRTIDQTSSQTGWGSQNTQTGTAYTSGASVSSSQIATHSYLTPYLSANTQYWWRAYAIDPGGSNTFSSASSINSFTTSVTDTRIQGNVNIRGNVHFGN